MCKRCGKCGDGLFAGNYESFIYPARHGKAVKKNVCLACQMEKQDGEITVIDTTGNIDLFKNTT